MKTKKKQNKRMLTLLLVMAMVMSMFTPAYASAEGDGSVYIANASDSATGTVGKGGAANTAGDKTENTDGDKTENAGNNETENADDDKTENVGDDDKVENADGDKTENADDDKVENTDDDKIENDDDKEENTEGDETELVDVDKDEIDDGGDFGVEVVDTPELDLSLLNFLAPLISTQSDLQEQIEAAEAGIVKTIELTGDIVLDAPIVIDGDKQIILTADSSVTLTSADGERHFNIDNPGKTTTLTLKNITLDGNHTGGGIYAKGIKAHTIDALTLKDVTIMNCVSNEGGGIWAESVKTLTLDNTKITGCEVTGHGAGIYANNCPDIHLGKGTSIENCNAITEDTKYGNGGGIYVNNATTLTVDGTTISDCTANRGGGIYTDEIGTVTLKGASFITGCKAIDGGGIYAMKGSLIITDVTFTDCTASGNGGGLNGFEAASIVMAGTTFEGCKADRQGGGMYSAGINSAGITDKTKLTLKNLTITDCDAGSAGGGLYAENGTLAISGTDISDCDATNTFSGNLSENGKGGGIAVYNMVFTLDASTITDCEAVITGGGLQVGIKSYGKNDKMTATVTDTTIEGCRSGTSGGGIYSDLSTCILNNTTINDCEAEVAGGGIFANCFPGVSSTPYGSLEIKDATITNCTAEDGGGVGVVNVEIEDMYTFHNIYFENNFAKKGARTIREAAKSHHARDVILHGTSPTSIPEEQEYIYNNYDVGIRAATTKGITVTGKIANGSVAGLVNSADPKNDTTIAYTFTSGKIHNVQLTFTADSGYKLTGKYTVNDAPLVFVAGEAMNEGVTYTLVGDTLTFLAQTTNIVVVAETESDGGGGGSEDKYTLEGKIVLEVPERNTEAPTFQNILVVDDKTVYESEIMVKDENGDIVNDDFTYTVADYSNIDFTTLYDYYEITVTAKNGTITATGTVIVSVVDRIKPVIAVTNPFITYKGEKPETLEDILLRAGIDVTDNYNENLTFTATFMSDKEAAVEFTDINWVIGNEYALHLNAKDTSGNEAEQVVVIIDLTKTGGSGGGGGGGTDHKKDVPDGKYEKDEEDNWIFVPGEQVELAANQITQAVDEVQKVQMAGNPILPQTGVNQHIVGMLLMAGAVFLLGGAALSRKAKKNEEK